MISGSNCEYSVFAITKIALIMFRSRLVRFDLTDWIQTVIKLVVIAGNGILIRGSKETPRNSL